MKASKLRQRKYIPMLIAIAKASGLTVKNSGLDLLTWIHGTWNAVDKIITKEEIMPWFAIMNTYCNKKQSMHAHLHLYGIQLIKGMSYRNSDGAV